MKITQNFYSELLFLIVGGIVLLLINNFQVQSVIFLLLSIIILSLQLITSMSYTNWLITVVLAVGGLFYPPLTYFFPAVSRYLLVSASPKTISPLLITLIFHFNYYSLLAASGCLLALYFDYQDRSLQHLQCSKLELLDDSFEKQAQLQAQNIKLQATEQTQLQLQLAQERNQIARDIHDNVGHLLSSSIIQLGAIRTINQNSQLNTPLTQLNSTLNQAMSSIRSSVHGMQQQALNLQQQLQPLLTDFTFCPIVVIGTPFNNLNPKMNQVILMTIKEALTNIMKHSTASKVSLKFQTLPAFYQVQIKDNGTKKSPLTHGMGLISMQQRAEEAGGQLHLYQNQNGFLITLILPKKDIKND
ncbi:sensor histidine kinase [Bombilactobacillus bombi]|uniref:sensor histidine kinase n=1 Tax=Bombilactobacillus bombi TaxID=1303590 RepID=UPI0015E5A4EF|nr:histidine kinase [Bombilactobacillus bombi]